MNALFSLIAVLQLAAAGTASTATATPPGSAAGEAAADVQTLARDLDRIIDSQGWRGDEWGVMVVSLDHGDTLFARSADRPLMPASNLKLFTTAAALHYLGPDYRFTTFLAGLGPLSNGVLEGDLLFYGTGDPSISDRFYDSETTVFERLADSLAARGVRVIRGDLIADGSYFQGRGVGTGWKRTYINASYAAPAGALSFNDNLVTLRITPAATVGWRPEVEYRPGGEGISIVNEALTSQGGQSFIRVERPDYHGPIVLKGQLRRGSSDFWRRVPVADPARYTASVFRETLAGRGIELEGSIRVVDDPARSAITARDNFAPAFQERPVPQVLAVHRSPPLQRILAVINQDSHNFYAEMVLRAVGRVVAGQGSAEAGEAAVRSMIEERVAAPMSELRMDDGSGLSPLNRASARSFIALLSDMARSEHRASYLETLPAAATNDLRRMQSSPAAGNLRAKTGTIDRVSALSGYVEAANGELLAFSIISNNVPSTWKAKRLEDRIGIRLAGFDRPRPRASAPPEDRVAAADTTTGVRPDSASPRPPPQAEAPPRYHTIQPGDTYDRIAREYGTTVDALQSANPDITPRRLIPGRRLRLPSGATGGEPEEDAPPATASPAETQPSPAGQDEPAQSTPREHVIQAGDTFDALARRYQVSVQALRDANPGIDPRRLIPGRRLRIPD